MKSAERDYAFEALVEVTGARLDALTPSERGRLNAALKELRGLDPGKHSYVLSAEIHERAKSWAYVYPDIPLTPQALTGSWSSIGEKAALVLQERQREDVRRRQQSNLSVVKECATCGGDRFLVIAVRPSLNETSGYEEVARCPECNGGTLWPR